ncbi:MAG: hypothetical protein Kow0077_06120 [Anaerolineae bacterium]
MKSKALFGGMLLLVVLVALPVAAQTETLPALKLMETATGTLDAGTPEARWSFEASEGDTVSVLVVPLAGDLDPVVQILDDTGRLVAEADDVAYPSRLEAALEAVPIPRDGTYTIRVARFEGGDSSGDFLLALLPSYAAPAFVETFDDPATWQVSDGGLAESSVVDGQLVMELDTPNALAWAVTDEQPEVPLDAYVQVEAEVTNEPDYWEYGLIVRQTGPTNYYLFSISSRGDWAFLYRSGGSTWLRLQDWTEHPALEGLEGRVRIGVSMAGQRFTFYVNGTALATLEADQITSSGRVSMSVGTIDQQETFPIVAFDNLLITTPLPADNGVDEAALLESWQQPDSALIAGELAGAGLIPDGGSQVMLVPESFTTVTRAGINILPLGQGRTQVDFVMGARLSVESDGSDNACGLVFEREADDRYGLAYVDSTGGVGIAFRQGDRFEPAQYATTDLEALDGARLLVVGVGDEVRVYVNGGLQLVQSHPMAEGGVGIAALSYDGRFVSCNFVDTWLWTWN